MNMTVASEAATTAHRTYSVVFEGILHPDYDELVVKDQLCRLAGVQPDSVKGRRVLGGYPVVLRAGLPLAAARHLEEQANIAGAICKVVGIRGRGSTVMCLRCEGKQMQPVRHMNAEMDVCPSCSGMWFERDELDKLIAERAVDPEYPELAIVEALSSYRGASKLCCPGCGLTLKRYELSPDSELDVEVCTNCYGIWIDRAKLEQAKAFYEAPRARKMIDEQKTTAGHWLFQFLLGLPVAFNIKARQFPYVTVSLIVLCSLAFLGTAFYPGGPEKLLHGWGVLYRHGDTLHWLLTLITYQFLHGGLFHLASNMYFLHILGNNLESALGRLHFAAFYLLCGVAGALAHLIVNPRTAIPMIGASGAIAGVMAGYMVIFRRARLTFMFIIWQKKLSAAWYMLIWVGFNLFGILIGSSSVAWHTHLGGFITGLAWSYLIYDRILNKNPLIKYTNKPVQEAFN